MLDEPAADHWPNSGRNRTKTRPGADGASPFVFRKRTADDCETAGNEQRCTQPLCCTRGNQLLYVGSKVAPRGRQAEERDANHKHSAPPVVISERSPAEQHRRKQK